MESTSQNFKMANYSFSLEDEMDEDFALVAIHCSEEEYKLAYLLNLNLDLKLKRRKVDLDFTFKGIVVPFPIYDFEDTFSHNSFFLVKNKIRKEELMVAQAGGLFSLEVSNKSTIHYLLPEFKKVDYLLKIYSDLNREQLKDFVSKIYNIKQVISAYTIEISDVKSKNNLIFD